MLIFFFKYNLNIQWKKGKIKPERLKHFFNKKYKDQNVIWQKIKAPILTVEKVKTKSTDVSNFTCSLSPGTSDLNRVITLLYSLQWHQYFHFSTLRLSHPAGHVSFPAKILLLPLLTPPEERYYQQITGTRHHFFHLKRTRIWFDLL